MIGSGGGAGRLYRFVAFFRVDDRLDDLRFLELFFFDFVFFEWDDDFFFLDDFLLLFLELCEETEATLSPALARKASAAPMKSVAAKTICMNLLKENLMVSRLDKVIYLGNKQIADTPLKRHIRKTAQSYSKIGEGQNAAV